MAASDWLVVLEPIAREELPVLRNLFELYAHDFSRYVPLDLHPNGRFDVAVEERWWTEAGHFPFFILGNRKLCGFALVRTGSRVSHVRDVMDMAELFVARGARRKGVGTSVAHALFTAFPGRWEVRVRTANAPARAFWSRAIEAWAGRRPSSTSHRASGVDWEVFVVEPSLRGR